MLADTSRQARAETGSPRLRFRRKFPASACGPCPVRGQCATAARGRRQLTLKPRAPHEVPHANPAGQQTADWQARHAIRAGVEGAMHQAVAVTGARHKGLPKTHLQHVRSALARNLIRLQAWRNGHPLHRRRTSHHARLEPAHAA